LTPDPLGGPDVDAVGSDALEPLTPGLSLLLIVAPVAGLGLLLVAAWALAGGEVAGFAGSMALGAFFGGGKLIILAGAVEQAPLGTWPLAALLVYMDLATALVVMGGMQHLYKVPAAGPRIAAARRSGWRFLQRHPWTRHATWLSLAGFVAVPFNGTGALVGALLGRMLGLSRWAILSATAVGAGAGAVALALVGDYWAERIDALAGHPFLAVASVVTLAALAILASRWMFGAPVDANAFESKGE
jgi:uncharacterized membrane protein